VGVISSKHANHKTIRKISSNLKDRWSNGFFNDHALKDVRYEKEIKKLYTNNSAQLLHLSYGDHLPKINLKSKIFVIKKNN